ncbi:MULTISPECIES: hypothetical protein [unclassified Microcoleus]
MSVRSPSEVRQRIRSTDVSPMSVGIKVRDSAVETASCQTFVPLA